MIVVCDSTMEEPISGALLEVLSLQPAMIMMLQLMNTVRHLSQFNNLIVLILGKLWHVEEPESVMTFMYAFARILNKT